MIPAEWNWLQYQKYKATQFGTEGNGDKPYTIGDQKVSFLTLDVIGGSINLSDLTASQYEDVSSDLRGLGFYENVAPDWFEKYLITEQSDFFSGLTPERKFQKLNNLWENTRQKVISSFQAGKTKGEGGGTSGVFGSYDPSFWLTVPK